MPSRAVSIRSNITKITALFAMLCAPVAAHASDELVIADQKGQQKALLEASGMDHNLPYHIRWTEFDAAAPLLQALGAGAVDAGIAGDGPFVFAWGAGLPVKAAFLLPPRGGGHTTAVVVASGSPIHDLADLSGKRIATGRGSIGHLLLLRLIATGKIPAPAPKIVFLSPAQAKAALDSGGIDAWSTWEPYVSLETMVAHGHVLADGAGVMPNNGFYVATNDALEHKHALLADFFSRVTKASAWGKEHQAEYATILARQTGLPDDVARELSTKLIVSPVPIKDDAVKAEQETLDAYRSAGFISTTKPIDTGFDESFVSP